MDIEKYLFEEWRAINGYEGLYEVSNYGRVRSLDRYVGHSTKGVKAFKRGKVLSASIRSGYYSVILSKEGKHKNEHIHRLVSFAFPEALYTKWFEGAEEINHRDENKLNNYVDPANPKNSNLEWCTKKYNSSYGTKGKRCSQKMTNGKLSKPILQFSLDGKFIKEWPSSMEIQRKLGFSANSIREAIRLNYKQMSGFIWKHKYE